MRKLLFLTILFLLPIFFIHAQEVDLLWQGDTYVSPFYQGRALWSNQSAITLAAIPRGLGNPAGLIYKWTRNGTVLGNISGIGKNSLSFSDSIISRPQTFKVDILSNDEKVLATASTFIVPISPTLLIYENNPLYGFMFHREINGVRKLQDQEITYTAFPFFYSVFNHTDNSINYEWRTNTGETESTNSVTYRIPDNTSGTSQIQVRAVSVDKILQDSNKSFLVEFGNQ